LRLELVSAGAGNDARQAKAAVAIDADHSIKRTEVERHGPDARR
jgi:hypothetical protein